MKIDHSITLNRAELANTLGQLRAKKSELQQTVASFMQGKTPAQIDAAARFSNHLAGVRHLIHNIKYQMRQLKTI